MTLLIITEYSDSARVWKVGGFWSTTQRAELTERMKSFRATNTQPDNSTLRRIEEQQMTHLRQQLREMTRQLQQTELEKNAETIRRNAEMIQQKDATNRRYAQAIQQKEAAIHQLQSDIIEKDLQIQLKNDVIQRHEGTITQQQKTMEMEKLRKGELVY